MGSKNGPKIKEISLFFLPTSIYISAEEKIGRKNLLRLLLFKVATSLALRSCFIFSINCCRSSVLNIISFVSCFIYYIIIGGKNTLNPCLFVTMVIVKTPNPTHVTIFIGRGVISRGTCLFSFRCSFIQFTQFPAQSAPDVLCLFFTTTTSSCCRFKMERHKKLNDMINLEVRIPLLVCENNEE